MKNTIIKRSQENERLRQEYSSLKNGPVSAEPSLNQLQQAGRCNTIVISGSPNNTTGGDHSFSTYAKFPKKSIFLTL